MKNAIPFHYLYLQDHNQWQETCQGEGLPRNGALQQSSAIMIPMLKIGSIWCLENVEARLFATNRMDAWSHAPEVSNHNAPLWPWPLTWPCLRQAVEYQSHFSSSWCFSACVLRSYITCHWLAFVPHTDSCSRDITLTIVPYLWPNILII